MSLPYRNRTAFLAACDGRRIHPTATLRCIAQFKCFKVWVERAGMAPPVHAVRDAAGRGISARSPFVDVHLYEVRETSVVIRRPNGDPPDAYERPHMARDAYLPLEPVFFGGLYALAPQRAWVTTQYSLTECYLGDYHHREFHPFRWHGLFDTLALDCCRPAARFPFVYANGTMATGGGRRQASLGVPPGALDRAYLRRIHASAPFLIDDRHLQ